VVGADKMVRVCCCGVPFLFLLLTNGILVAISISRSQNIILRFYKKRYIMYLVQMADFMLD